MLRRCARLAAHGAWVAAAAPVVARDVHRRSMGPAHTDNGRPQVLACSTKDDKGASGLSPEELAQYRALAMSAMGPVVAQATFGGVMGFCTGVAVKRLGKLFAVVLGVGFLAVQGLASEGYINVHWERMQEKVIRALDVDGDGELTEKDLATWSDRAMDLAQYNLPSGGGFVTGLMLGVRW